MRTFFYYSLFFFSLGLLSTPAFAQPKGMKPIDKSQMPAGTERRLALVIGNKDYTRPEARLQNPLNDANDVTATLQQLGFEVIKRTNLDRAGLETAIDDFAAKLTSYDVGLFYFSGHGMAFQGENYLLPTDANLSFENQARSQCVSLRRILDGMEGAQAKVSLVLLDACRNNPFKRSWSRSTGGNGLVIPNNPRGSMVAFATREGSTADDNVSESNGLFTSELLKHLRTPNLGLRDILDRTIDGVETRSGGRQVPGRYDELRGNFVFVQTASPIAKTEPYTPPKREEPTRVEPAKPKAKIFMDLPFAEMAYVEGGTFQMGDTRGEGGADEKPVHSVTVSSFYMSKYEITQRQWESVMGSNPSYFKDCGDCPVEKVSWEDVQEFLKRLNARTGGSYRLPTEAEWEYAAGGGSGTRTRFGNGRDVLDATEANFYSKADAKEPYSVVGDYRTKTIKVGSFRPNGLGLYDMTGNVLEWCSDWYGDYSSSASINPTGPTTGSYRVLRGGSWGDNPANSRVAYRNGYTPSDRDSYVGFRVVSLQ
ncbi:SUMF1/EgtB/PvdO family nonheme iron enzyme [Runella sp. MFBS21]|uniref:SUMF1/EgtB/PvdO family nonheme iron enzyme n=1 Tax=Runella sp. MFBS21 TaxID=3034018 RepID=UPI0023F9A9B2|nr:SUMF1/EgtB/PvdO family nonheme iron enzyme [Runella sp. MFBS21]MDF7821827.1 SUMF1/EgtB/PvdO family nonheme iron enzyme [Runella sp. MFBS21]